MPIVPIFICCSMVTLSQFWACPGAHRFPSCTHTPSLPGTPLDRGSDDCRHRGLPTVRRVAWTFTNGRQPGFIRESTGVQLLCTSPNVRHIDTSRGTAFHPSDLHRLTSQAPPGALHGQHVAADEARDAESPRRGHTEGLACTRSTCVGASVKLKARRRGDAGHSGMVSARDRGMTLTRSIAQGDGGRRETKPGEIVPRREVGHALAHIRGRVDHGVLGSHRTLQPAPHSRTISAQHLSRERVNRGRCTGYRRLRSQGG